MATKGDDHIFGHIAVIKRNGDDKTKFTMSSPTCLCGRDKDSEIRICNRAVSWNHCLLKAEMDRKVYLIPLQLGSPTQLNGTPIFGKTILCHNDIFTIADRHFRFEYPQSSPLYVKSDQAPPVLPLMAVGVGPQKRQYGLPQKSNENLVKTKSRLSEPVASSSVASVSSAKRRLSAQQHYPLLKKQLISKRPVSGIGKMSSLLDYHQNRKKVSFGPTLSHEQFDPTQPTSRPLTGRSVSTTTSASGGTSMHKLAISTKNRVPSKSSKSPKSAFEKSVNCNEDRDGGDNIDYPDIIIDREDSETHRSIADCTKELVLGKLSEIEVLKTADHLKDKPVIKTYSRLERRGISLTDNSSMTLGEPYSRLHAERVNIAEKPEPAFFGKKIPGLNRSSFRLPIVSNFGSLLDLSSSSTASEDIVCIPVSQSFPSSQIVTNVAEFKNAQNVQENSTVLTHNSSTADVDDRNLVNVDLCSKNLSLCKGKKIDSKKTMGDIALHESKKIVDPVLSARQRISEEVSYLNKHSSHTQNRISHRNVENIGVFGFSEEKNCGNISTGNKVTSGVMNITPEVTNIVTSTPCSSKNFRNTRSSSFLKTAAPSSQKSVNLKLASSLRKRKSAPRVKCSKPLYSEVLKRGTKNYLHKNAYVGTPKSHRKQNTWREYNDSNKDISLYSTPNIPVEAFVSPLSTSSPILVTIPSSDKTGLLQQNTSENLHVVQENQESQLDSLANGTRDDSACLDGVKNLFQAISQQSLTNCAVSMTNAPQESKSSICISVNDTSEIKGCIEGLSRLFTSGPDSANEDVSFTINFRLVPRSETASQKSENASKTSVLSPAYVSVANNSNNALDSSSLNISTNSNAECPVSSPAIGNGVEKASVTQELAESLPLGTHSCNNQETTPNKSEPKHALRTSTSLKSVRHRKSADYKLCEEGKFMQRRGRQKYSGFTRKSMPAIMKSSHLHNLKSKAPLFKRNSKGLVKLCIEKIQGKAAKRNTSSSISHSSALDNFITCHTITSGACNISLEDQSVTREGSSPAILKNHNFNDVSPASVRKGSMEETLEYEAIHKSAQFVHPNSGKRSRSRLNENSDEKTPNSKKKELLSSKKLCVREEDQCNNGFQISVEQICNESHLKCMQNGEVEGNLSATESNDQCVVHENSNVSDVHRIAVRSPKQLQNKQKVRSSLRRRKSSISLNGGRKLRSRVVRVQPAVKKTNKRKPGKSKSTDLKSSRGELKQILNTEEVHVLPGLNNDEKDAPGINEHGIEKKWVPTLVAKEVCNKSDGNLSIVHNQNEKYASHHSRVNSSTPNTSLSLQSSKRKRQHKSVKRHKPVRENGEKNLNASNLATFDLSGLFEVKASSANSSTVFNNSGAVCEKLEQSETEDQHICSDIKKSNVRSKKLRISLRRKSGILRKSIRTLRSSALKAQRALKSNGRVRVKKTAVRSCSTSHSSVPPTPNSSIKNDYAHQPNVAENEAKAEGNKSHVQKVKQIKLVDRNHAAWKKASKMSRKSLRSPRRSSICFKSVRSLRSGTVTLRRTSMKKCGRSYNKKNIVLKSPNTLLKDSISSSQAKSEEQQAVLTHEINTDVSIKNTSSKKARVCNKQKIDKLSLCGKKTNIAAKKRRLCSSKSEECCQHFTPPGVVPEIRIENYKIRESEEMKMEGSELRLNSNPSVESGDRKMKAKNDGSSMQHEIKRNLRSATAKNTNNEDLNGKLSSIVSTEVLLPVKNKRTKKTVILRASKSPVKVSPVRRMTRAAAKKSAKPKRILK